MTTTVAIRLYLKVNHASMLWVVGPKVARFWCAEAKFTQQHAGLAGLASSAGHSDSTCNSLGPEISQSF